MLFYLSKNQILMNEFKRNKKREKQKTDKLIKWDNKTNKQPTQAKQTSRLIPKRSKKVDSNSTIFRRSQEKGGDGPRPSERKPPDIYCGVHCASETI